MARKEHHPGEEEKNDSAEKETYGAEIESASNARRFSNNSVTGNRHNTLPSRSGPPHVKSANRGGVVKSRGDRIQMEPTISSSVSSHRAPSPAAASIVPVPVQPHTYRSSSVTTRSNPVNSQAAYNQTAPHHPGRRATHVSGMDGDSIYVELSQLKHEQVQLRRSLEQIRTERDTLVERLKESDMLREDAEALCIKVQSLMDENMQLEKKLSQILSERNAAQSYLQRQTEETAQFRSQCHKLEETVECNKISMSSKDTKLTELEEKVQELQGKLRDQKIKLEEEEATVGHLRVQLRQATEEVDSLRVAKLAAESVQEELLSTIREQQELEHERVSSRQRTHVEHELNASTAVENCGKLEVVLDECRSLREQMAEIQKLLPQCMERGIEKAMYRKENSETAELRVRIEELVGLLSVSEAARKLATSELRLSRAIAP